MFDLFIDTYIGITVSNQKFYSGKLLRIQDNYLVLQQDNNKEIYISIDYVSSFETTDPPLSPELLEEQRKKLNDAMFGSLPEDIRKQLEKKVI